MIRTWLLKLALPALLLFLGAWGGWAVVSDNQPTFADSLLPDSETLQDTVLGSYGLGNYVTQLRYRPPLSHVPPALLFLVNGAPDLTLARLGVLLQYLLMVGVAFSIGAAAAGRSPGLLAAVLVGTFPMIYGWGRLAYMDAPLALMVLVCVRVLMNNPLKRTRDGVLLGLAAGGGMLTKVAFPIFALGPVLWVVALRVRSVRALGMLGLALGTCLVVISWWLVPNLTAILTNIGMSSTGSSEGLAQLRTMGVTFSIFVLDAPGGLPLILAALGSGVAAWFIKPKAGPGRSFIGLGLLTLCLSLTLLLLFQPLPRYVVPVYAVAAVLCGTCLGGIILDRAGRAGGVILGVLAGLCLLLFVLLNLGLIQPKIPKENIVASASPRVSSAGMLAPDQRNYDALQQARNLIETFKFTDCLVVATGPWISERSQYHLDMLNTREGAGIFHSKISRVPRDKPACILLLAGKDKEEVRWRDFTPQNERGFFDLCRTHAWFKAVIPDPGEVPWCPEVKDPKATCEMGSWNNSPLNQRIFVFRLGSGQIPDKMPKDPICKLDQVEWEEVVQPGSAESATDSPQSDPEATTEPSPLEVVDPDLKEEEPPPKEEEGEEPPPEVVDPDVKPEDRPQPPEVVDPDLKEEEQPPREEEEEEPPPEVVDPDVKPEDRPQPPKVVDPDLKEEERPKKPTQETP